MPAYFLEHHQKFLFPLFLVGIYAVPSQAAVSAFSRSNCYVPIAEVGWESLTWGWPQSSRATSSWHLRFGENRDSAHNLIAGDNWEVQWHSIASDSHGALGLTGKYEVRGKHWWGKSPGQYHYKNSYAIDCNLSEF
ncbi:hypothetical protein [Pseudoalteromonas nigrifaciens]